MAMTAEVKDELSRLTVNSVSARRAEVAALLRFAGGLHIVAGRVVVEAEVDLGIIAQPAAQDIFDLYGYNAVVHVLSASGIRKHHVMVRVAKDGEALARQTGLLDLRGRPVAGLPAPPVVGGSIADAEAAWRGVPGARIAHRAGPFLGTGSPAARVRRRPWHSSARPVGSGQCQGARGPRRRSGGGARRRGHRRAADPDGRPGHASHLGGAPDAPRGAGDGQPAGQLRRREPAPLGTRGGGRGGPRRAGAEHPRRRGARPSGRGGQAAGRAPAGVPGGARPPRRPADDERRCGRPDSAAAVDGRPQGQTGRHPDTESAVTPELLDEA